MPLQIVAVQAILVLHSVAMSRASRRRGLYGSKGVTRPSVGLHCPCYEFCLLLFDFNRAVIHLHNGD